MPTSVFTSKLENVCLTAAARRRAVPAPDRSRSAEVGIEQVRHLTLYPDQWLDELEATVGNRVPHYGLRESVQLGFLAAGQFRTLGPPRDEIERSLVRRFLETWEADDLDRLVGLLRADAVLTMPPLGLRYVGREAIAAFFATTPYPGAAAYIRLLPTRANRQPSLAAYLRDPHSRAHRAVAIAVLTVDGEEIAEITGFTDRSLFPTFGLPMELGPDQAPRGFARVKPADSSWPGAC